MSNNTIYPTLHFFRTTPNNLKSNLELCSSLQHLESAFFLISLGRYSHALVSCVTAIENSIKAKYPENKREKLVNLLNDARMEFSELQNFTENEISNLRIARNRIVHQGFSPKDDDTASKFLLKTGFRFIRDCYIAFFNFDLEKGLLHDFFKQLSIAIEVYEKVQSDQSFAFKNCFIVFGHLVRWSIKDSLMPSWEIEASQSADEIGAKFDLTQNEKKTIIKLFGDDEYWSFNCPICIDFEPFICEIDNEFIENGEIILKRAKCVNCGLAIPSNIPHLTNEICKEQVIKKSSEIFEAYGVESNN